jgi:hypothetical protein
MLRRWPRTSPQLAGPAAARGHVDQRPVHFIDNAVERGWVYGSLMFGDTPVRTGYLLVGMLKTPSLRNALLAISRSSSASSPTTCADRFADRGGSPEDGWRQRRQRRRARERPAAPSPRPPWASRRR